MDLSKKILSDPVNRWIFSNAGDGAYLVGGCMRDMLFGIGSKDRDFALAGSAREAATAFAEKYNGTFIELKKDMTYRVVIKGGRSVDFSGIETDIIEDLKRRDYTINAIAWSPRTGMIDPMQGQADLKKRKIRMVSPGNLQSDPLRLLRAYRIAAGLDFKIEETTRKYLKKHSKKVHMSAPERITEELFKLLNHKKAFKYLWLCHEDSVLCNIFNVRKPVLKESLMHIKRFDLLMNRINKKSYQGLNTKKMLINDVSQGLNTTGFMRLALLLINSSVNTAESPKLLRFSNLIKKKITHIKNGYSLIKGRMTGSKLFEILHGSEESAFEMSLILELTRKGNAGRFIKRAGDLIKIKRKPLLTGYEIQDIINTGPGVVIGEIQDKIIERQFLGYVTNKREARTWIISNLT